MALSGMSDGWQDIPQGSPHRAHVPLPSWEIADGWLLQTNRSAAGGLVPSWRTLAPLGRPACGSAREVAVPCRLPWLQWALPGVPGP